MALPTARVKIEILKLTALPSVTLGSGHTRYARASFQAGSAPKVQTGRSRPVPDAGGDFDLTTEAAPWVYEVSVPAGTNITVTVELSEDHGDDSPPSPTAFSATIADPWKSGTFPVPPFHYRVTTTLVNPTDAAFLARAAKATGVSGTLRVPQAFAVEIVDIDGLYKPDLSAAIPAPGSVKVKGYLSEDNLGRIFTNRKPDGSWSKDEQYIDVSVTITAIGLSKIPGAAKVKWTVIDADDPTNDAPDFHREWGLYVDANDYDAAGNPTGAHAGDNAQAYSAGNADESLLFGKAVSAPTARWQQVPRGPAVAPISRTEAESNLVAGVTPTSATSKIRIHGMNVLGTNLAVKADLSNVPPKIPVHFAFTGIMTMWSRIDVEVKRMAGAHSVAGALANVASRFLPACVQLDFQKEIEVTGSLDKPVMAPDGDDDHVDAASVAWLKEPGVFSNKGKPGWFFLGAARLPNPMPGAAPPPVFSDTKYTLGTSGTIVTVEVKGTFPSVNFAEFSWKDAAGTSLSASFAANSRTAGGKTTLSLIGNDAIPGFTGHDADGSSDHAYKTSVDFFPQHQTAPGSSTLLPGGFGVPSTGAMLKLWAPGATATSGVSPPVPDPATGTGEFFAGRTILFTHHRKFSLPTFAPKPNFDAVVVQTVMHEFLHAFGMPHKCGNWAWRTPLNPPAKKACCMNYFYTWLLDSTGKLIPGSVGNQGDDMCGRHLMEVRRVHLDRNPGLNWR